MSDATPHTMAVTPRWERIKAKDFMPGLKTESTHAHVLIILLRGSLSIYGGVVYKDARGWLAFYARRGDGTALARITDDARPYKTKAEAMQALVDWWGIREESLV